MQNTLKRLGLGTVLWVIPFAASIPLLPLMQSDVLAFKAIMVLIGSIVGPALAVYYFLDVKKEYLRESIVLAVTWLLVNWFLDIVILLQFTHQTLAQYFSQIGVEYIGMTAPIIAIGYLLERKQKI